MVLDQILNDFVSRGARFGASLPRPRAFEYLVLGRMLNDFVPRGDGFGDVVALAARRWIHGFGQDFNDFAPRGARFRASVHRPRVFECMVLDEFQCFALSSVRFGDVVALPVRL